MIRVSLILAEREIPGSISEQPYSEF